MTAYYNRGAYSYAHYSAGSVFDCTGAMPTSFHLNGSYANPVNASGGFAIQFGFAGRLSIAYSASGALPIDVSIDPATLSRLLALKGDLAFMVSVNEAPVIAAPLWGADPDIATTEPWTPSELCNG